MNRMSKINVFMEQLVELTVACLVVLICTVIWVGVLGFACWGVVQLFN